MKVILFIVFLFFHVWMVNTKLYLLSQFILVSEATSYNFILTDPLGTLPLKTQYSTEVLLLSKWKTTATPRIVQVKINSAQLQCRNESFNQTLIQIWYWVKVLSFLKSARDHTFAATCLRDSSLAGQECRSNFSMCQLCVNLATW